MASILFVVPRFHTNLFFATKALIEAGHDVAVFAETQSRIEDHSFVAPIVMPSEADPAFLRARLSEVQPDLTILRYPSRLSRQVYAQARRLGLRALGYDQHPLTQRRGWRKRLSYWMENRPWLRVTPVRGLDADAPKDRAAFDLPWPIEEVVQPVGHYRNMASEPVRVLCVGKLAQPRKRQDALIEAMDGLWDRATLTLVGATDRDISGMDEAHWKALRRAARRNPAITIKSDISFADMPGIFARHHVCVLPSERETLGVAPVEAMAYGTIPVISEGAGSAGYIISGENGFRVNMDHSGELSDTLVELVEDAELRRRLSQGARRTAETDLSPQTFVERIEQLLAK